MVHRSMDIVFRVVWSGCPVSRSPLRRKDEQRIRRVAGEQLQQRLEASKRTSMQSGRVHTDMVHLGLVEVLGDMRYRRANQTGSLYSRRCQQLELRGCWETERPTAMQPGAVQKGCYVVDQTAEKSVWSIVGMRWQASRLLGGREEWLLPDQILQVFVLSMPRIVVRQPRTSHHRFRQVHLFHMVVAVFNSIKLVAFLFPVKYKRGAR